MNDFFSFKTLPKSSATLNICSRFKCPFDEDGVPTAIIETSEFLIASLKFALLQFCRQHVEF